MNEKTGKPFFQSIDEKKKKKKNLDVL